MIADAIRQAQKMHRTMIEQTYDGIYSIYQIVHEKDPDTKVTKQQERQMEYPLRSPIILQRRPFSRNDRYSHRNPRV